MYDIKEDLKNRILVDMKDHLDKDTLNILEQVILKNLNGLDVNSASALATVDHTNEFIIQLFMVKKANKLSKETSHTYLMTLKEFLEFSNLQLTQVNTYDIEMFINHVSERGITGKTTNNYLRNLSAFFDFMYKNELITKNPCNGVERFPEVQKPIEHLSAVEMDLLRKGCKSLRQRAMLEFLRCTATRRGEVVNLNVSDVDFNTGRVNVYATKNRKFRTVYIDDIAKKYLKLYLEERQCKSPNEPLFCSINKNNRITAHGVYDIIKYLSEQTNVRCYPHLLRKTTATNICKRGGSDEQAGEYLGHTPRTVTGRHYTYRGDQYIENVFRQYVESV